MPVHKLWRRSFSLAAVPWSLLTLGCVLVLPFAPRTLRGGSVLIASCVLRNAVAVTAAKEKRQTIEQSHGVSAASDNYPSQ